MRWRTLFVASSLVLGAPAAAQDAGIPVTVRVLDEAGKPVATAVVRHPDEKERHRVNTTTGAWTDSVLYLPDGSELVFEKGLRLELEVSAPGYVTEKLVYQVRKRKNLVEVRLKPMDLQLEVEDDEDPIIQFGRDKPVDGAPGDPAN